MLPLLLCTREFPHGCIPSSAFRAAVFSELTLDPLTIEELKKIDFIQMLVLKRGQCALPFLNSHQLIKVWHRADVAALLCVSLPLLCCCWCVC